MLSSPPSRSHENVISVAVCASTWKFLTKVVTAPEYRIVIYTSVIYYIIHINI